MKMCQPHWDQLRAGVRERGMEHLVLPDGEAARDNIDRELAGDPDAHFDPLMSANCSLFTTAIECGGLDMMNGAHCPLCEADANGGQAQAWITGCLDAQLAHARERGLVPRIQ